MNIRTMLAGGAIAATLMLAACQKSEAPAAANDSNAVDMADMNASDMNDSMGNDDMMNADDSQHVAETNPGVATTK